jgi:hypothetical protein
VGDDAAGHDGHDPGGHQRRHGRPLTPVFGVTTAV